MNEIAKLLTAESKVVFTTGRVYEGATGVSELLIKTVELAFAKASVEDLKSVSLVA